VASLRTPAVFVVNEWPLLFVLDSVHVSPRWELSLVPILVVAPGVMVVDGEQVVVVKQPVA